MKPAGKAENTQVEDEGLSPWGQARRRFRRNPWAMGALIWILLNVVVAVFAYPLIPDKTSHANFQVPELAKQAPGTAYRLILLPVPGAPQAGGWLSRTFTGIPDRYRPVPVTGPEPYFAADTLIYHDIRGMETRLLLPEVLLLPDGPPPAHRMSPQVPDGKPYLLTGNTGMYSRGGNICSFTLDSLQTAFRAEHLVQGTFLLGSDGAGRDVLSRLVLGARVSLSVGLMAVLVSLVLGVTLGALAGFFRGWVDAAVMWFVSVVWSVPTLLLAISLSFVLGKGYWQLFLAIGVSLWVDVARMVRGQIFSLREMQYVEATRALGFRPARSIFRHILPNILSPILILSAANFSTAILVEAGLSFLGIGVNPPVPSWGGMVYEGYTQIFFSSGTWLALYPGLAMVLIVVSLNLAGTGLRDALDPRHQLKR